MPPALSSLSQEAEVLYKSYSLSKSNTWIALVSSGNLGVPLSWSLASTTSASAITLIRDAKSLPSSVAIAVWEGLIRSVERAASDVPNGASIIPSLVRAILVTAVPFSKREKIVSAAKDAVHGLRFLQSYIEKESEEGGQQQTPTVFANPMNESLKLQARSSLRDLVSFSEQLLERVSANSGDNDGRHYMHLSESTSCSAITKLALQSISRAAKRTSYDILSYKVTTIEDQDEHYNVDEDDDEDKDKRDGKSTLEQSGKKENIVLPTSVTSSQPPLSASARKRLKKKEKKKTSATLQVAATASVIRPIAPLRSTSFYFALGISPPLVYKDKSQQGGAAGHSKHLNFPLDLFFMDLIEDAILALEHGATCYSNSESLSSILADLSIGWSQYASSAIVSGCVVHFHPRLSTDSCIFAMSPPLGSVSKQLSLSETSFNAAMFRLLVTLKRMTFFHPPIEVTQSLVDMDASSLYQEVFEKKSYDALLDVIFKPVLHLNEAEAGLIDLINKEGGVEIRDDAIKTVEEEGFLEDIPYYCNEGLLSGKDESWVESVAVRVEPQALTLPVSPHKIAPYTLIAVAAVERIAQFNDGVKAELASRGFSRIYRYCVESVLLPIHLPALISGGTGPRPLPPSSEGKAAVTANSPALKNVLTQWQKHERERGASLVDEDTPSWLLHDLVTKDGAEAADGVRAIYWAAAVATVSGPLKFIRAKKLESLRSISHAVNGKSSDVSLPPHLSPPLPPSPRKGDVNTGKAMAIKALGTSAIAPAESSPIVVSKQDLDRVARLELEKSVDKDLSKLPQPLPIPIPEEEEEEIIDY